MFERFERYLVEHRASVLTFDERHLENFLESVKKVSVPGATTGQLAASHSYDITRRVSLLVAEAGFDGIVYPSYFSLLRTGAIPFETAYGLSGRVIARYAEHEQSKIVPNLALFGYPIAEGKVEVKCVNRLLVTRVEYDLKFGPVGVA
jgi:hypothetical protein